MAENTYIDKFHVDATSLEECGQKASVQKADKDICIVEMPTGENGEKKDNDISIVETPSGETGEKKDKGICNVDETPMWETCEKRDNDIRIVGETPIGESDVKREKDIRIVNDTPMLESGQKRHKDTCNVDETPLGETGEIRDKDICIVDETPIGESDLKRDKDIRIVYQTPIGESGGKRDKDICNANEMPLEESSNMGKFNVDKMLEEESGENAVMNKCNDHETPKEENVDKADIDKCYVGTSVKEKCEKSDIVKCTDIPLLGSAENVHMDQYNIDETILKRSGEKADIIDKFDVAEMPKEESSKDADTHKRNDYDMPQDKSCKEADLIKCSEDKTPMQKSTVKANIEKRFTDEFPLEECFEKADTDDYSNYILTQEVGDTTTVYASVLDNTLYEKENVNIQRRADEDMNKWLVGDTQLKEVGAGGIHKETERNISKCDPCLFEDAEVEATTFCTDCSEHLCLNCSREHRKNKSSRYHMLLDFDDIIKDAVVIETLKSMMTCPDHPETMVTYKCEDHDRLLCVTCLAENHRKCNHVSEISNAKKPGNEDTCTRVKETLCQLQERITALKHTSEEHIASLRSQLAVTQSEQQSFFSSMHEKLTQAENKLESQTKMLVNEEMDYSERTLRTCKDAEAREIECRKVFDFILKFGHSREMNVIPDLILKRVKCISETIEEERRRDRKSLIFERNIDVDIMSNMANISTVPDGQHEQKRIIAVVSASSDATKESANEMTALSNSFIGDCTQQLSFSTHTYDIPMQIRHPDIPDNRGLSHIQYLDDESNHTILMSRNIDHMGIAYNVKCRSDYEPCNIYAIECLPDGRTLLIDKNNQKFKVLDKAFSVATLVSFYFKPIDLCHVRNTTFAIAFEYDKSIEMYDIDGRYASRVGKFQTKLHPISIACFGNKKNIAVLFKDEEGEFIQIRDTDTGRIDTTLCFERAPGVPFIFANDKIRRLLCIGTDEFFVSTDCKIHCFIGNLWQDRHRIQESWSYKNRTSRSLINISDLAADSERNIYVCGHDSYNVHQISKDDFSNNRILLSNIRKPISLSVNSKKGFVVVGGAYDDCLHVYHFL